MADSRLHERDRRKSDDENAAAAADHDDRVTQIMIKVSVLESFISESSMPRKPPPPPPSHPPSPPVVTLEYKIPSYSTSPEEPTVGASGPPSYRVYRREPTDAGKRKATMQNIIIVTSDSLQSINKEKRFAEEEAVCNICYGKFVTQNMFMTRCNCPEAVLIHGECKSATEGNNKCKVCEQEVTSFAVKWRRESIKSDIKTSTRQRQRFCCFCFKSSN